MKNKKQSHLNRWRFNLEVFEIDSNKLFKIKNSELKNIKIMLKELEEKFK